MKQPIIYIVEDDAHIAQLVKYNLDSSGYIAEIFDDGKLAIQAILENAPDLVLLDIMLPSMNGIEILKMIRSSEKIKKLSVIMLTAKSDEFDKVLGLELGADDYIAKPFGIRELSARVKAVLRRKSYDEESPAESEPEIIEAGNLKIDITKHRVYLKSTELELTYKEFELLKYLIKNRGKVLKRDFLLDEIWGYIAAVETRTVDVHIRRLRSLIGDAYIETVRGMGYRFTDKVK